MSTSSAIEMKFREIVKKLDFLTKQDLVEMQKELEELKAKTWG